MNKTQGSVNRAFTLIELLVVIAIIAILAAILFPVFAQAKLAAKKAASLSNVKETGLAEIMYQGDYDDYFALYLSGKYGNLGCPTATDCADGLAQPSDSWVGLTEPYIKNFGIFVDPGVQDYNGYVAGANSWHYTQARRAQYGYNYLFLSPFWQCSTALARSSSVGVHPSTTVMFTTSQSFTTGPFEGWFGSNAPGAWPIIDPAPNACIWWDGTTGSGNWSANNGSVGKITSSTRAIKPYGGAVVVWVDGHAKFMNDGALAAGTDYGSAAYNNASSGAVINNINNYLWTLDGTTNDLGL